MQADEVRDAQVTAGSRPAEEKQTAGVVGNPADPVTRLGGEIHPAQATQNVASDETRTQVTLIVNLDTSVDEFECRLGDGRRSFEAPTAGYMAIVPAGSPFSGALRGRRNKYTIWTMQAGALACLAEEAGIRGPVEIAPRLAHRDAAVYGLIEQIARLATAEDSLAEIGGDALNRRLALHLIRAHNVHGLGLPPRVKGQILSPKAAIALEEHIHRHLAEKITLDVLARIAGTTVHNLLLGFRQRFGTTPHRYVIEQRLMRARWMLARTGKPISEIAFDVGFSGQSHMTTVFARHLSITPSAFRKSAR